MRLFQYRFPAFGGIHLLLCVPLGVAAAVLSRFALLLPDMYAGFIARQGPDLRDVFMKEGMETLALTLAIACGLSVLLFLAGATLGLTKKPARLAFLRRCYIGAYVLFALYVFAVFHFTGVIFNNELKVDGLPANAVSIFFMRWNLIWPAALAAAAFAALHVLSWRRMALNVYENEYEDAPAPGDRLVENIRTFGPDPMFRKSVVLSVAGHLMVLVMIPILVRMAGCVDPYLVPEGDGAEIVVNMVKIVKPKKQVKKKYVLNYQADILFHIPDLDESRLLEEVEEDTKLYYTADPASVHKKQRGKGSGWPGGMKNAVVRFIRIQYDGDDWDDGMDAVDRADLNFLDEFSRVTGFKTSKNNESYPIFRLDDFPKGYAPPFVYMTGAGKINIPPRDIEILRRYLVDGGMLFADCASPQFDRNFRAFISVLFPGEPLLVVADDDPIYQYPFVFANGAPPLWHHGGSKALGIKRGNRWLVYYHPGDLNDAWKTGHSGLNPALAKRSMQVGINVIYHAFTHYLEMTRKFRK